MADFSCGDKVHLKDDESKEMTIISIPYNLAIDHHEKGYITCKVEKTGKEEKYRPMELIKKE